MALQSFLDLPSALLRQFLIPRFILIGREDPDDPEFYSQPLPATLFVLLMINRRSRNLVTSSVAWKLLTNNYTLWSDHRRAALRQTFVIACRGASSLSFVTWLLEFFKIDVPPSDQAYAAAAQGDYLINSLLSNFARFPIQLTSAFCCKRR
jgi:hypothetical protein